MQSSVFSTCLFLPTPAKNKISVVAGGYWVLLVAIIIATIGFYWGKYNYLQKPPSE
jgi:hypothetical protein